MNRECSFNTYVAELALLDVYYSENKNTCSLIQDKYLHYTACLANKITKIVIIIIDRILLN